MVDRIRYERAPSLNSVWYRGAYLELGDKGRSVKELQRQLQLLGYRIDDDGYYGEQTEAAVRHFQRRAGIREDGLAGRQTLRAIEQALNAPEQPVDGLEPTAARDAQRSIAAPALAAQLVRPASRPPRRAAPGAEAAAAPSPMASLRLQRPATRPRRGAEPGAPDFASFAPAPGRATGPFASERSARAWQAEAILRANGAWPPAPGQLLVIQIDQDSPPPPPPAMRGGTREERLAAQATRRQAQQAVSRYLTSYTGQTVVFRAERADDGSICLRELNVHGPYRSASHPAQRTATGYTDFDGNGTTDIATLRAGVFTYRGRSYRGRFNPTHHEQMRVGRDLNQDGVVSPEESRRTAREFGTWIQIHPGTESGPLSVGCQAIDPRQYNEFRRLIERERVDTFTYVLVRRPNESTGEYVW